MEQNANDYLRLVITLALSVIVLSVVFLMVSYFNGNDRGIRAITKQQEMQQFEVLEELDGTRMSGAATTSLIREYADITVGFVLDGEHFGFNLVQNGEFYNVDIEDYYEFDKQLTPQDVYELEVLYNQNRVPTGIRFTKQ